MRVMASAHDAGPVPGPWQAQLGALGAFIRAQRQLADLSLREMAGLDSDFQCLPQPGRAGAAPAIADGVAGYRGRARTDH